MTEGKWEEIPKILRAKNQAKNEKSSSFWAPDTVVVEGAVVLLDWSRFFFQVKCAGRVRHVFPLYF